jgi:2-polyprenyl-6-methoxyphenol hydroxylase-like FAD-dependent oxidoreductase
LGERILALMFPVRPSGMQRLIGLAPPDLSDREGLTFEDVRGETERLLDVKGVEVNWFSVYRPHHRVAERFRVGRAFLSGDAGRIHSPVGGQGMNTGIGDANLGWTAKRMCMEKSTSRAANLVWILTVSRGAARRFAPALSETRPI